MVRESGCFRRAETHWEQMFRKENRIIRKYSSLSPKKKLGSNGCHYALFKR